MVECTFQQRIFYIKEFKREANKELLLSVYIDGAAIKLTYKFTRGIHACHTQTRIAAAARNSTFILK